MLLVAACVHAEDKAAIIAQKAKTHWAFLPVKMPASPSVREASWCGTPVDRFIEAKLEENEISHSPEASRTTLIRRLTFDLTGLPPAPAEVEQFLADSSSNAYEKLVDRLLASSHYGERWGRYWLDAVGYADSNGYFDADSDRPLAWKYRDYVIRSFNSDKPLDRFLLEQFAGDELAGYTPGGDITPQMIDSMVATHLLRNAPDGTSESDGNPLELKVDRYAVLESNLQIIGTALLGLTVQCTRCHDHKFEPIKQSEYYGMQAILRPSFDPEKWLKPNDRALMIGTKPEREANKKAIAKHDHESKALQKSLEAALAPLRDLVLTENLSTIEEKTRGDIRKALDTKSKERNEEMKALLKKYETLVEIKDEDIFKRFPAARQAADVLKQSVAQYEKSKPAPLESIAVVTEPDAPLPVHHILVRGSHANEGAEAPPTVPAAFCSERNPYLPEKPAGSHSSGRRLAFAKWLTSPANPLPARVFVNRLWQHHFGVGIVSTPENLGLSGAAPSHPELLDYLAASLISNGWKVKPLQKMIVMSAAYRQSSRSREEALAKDPDNRLLWRFGLQRLDADCIRDAMLAASGELDLAIGGAFVPVAKTEEGQYIINETEQNFRRRSIYLQQRRTKPVTMLAMFDGQQMGLNCTRRNVSTVPLQSLAMLNADFVRHRAGKFAQRVLHHSQDPESRIQFAFATAYNRPSSPQELATAKDFLISQLAAYTTPEAEAQAWSDLCQMLYASSSFLYLE